MEAAGVQDPVLLPLAMGQAELYLEELLIGEQEQGVEVHSQQEVELPVAVLLRKLGFMKSKHQV